MRKLFLAILFMIALSGLAMAATPAARGITEEPMHFSFDLKSAQGAQLVVAKTAARQPGFLNPAYLAVGEIFRSPLSPTAKVELDFTFWDAGEYEVRVEAPGQAPQVQGVAVNTPSSHRARTAAILGGLLLLGLLVGYVSYTLPRPGAAAPALLLLVLAPALILGGSGAARAHGAESHGDGHLEGTPRAYERATLTFDLPEGEYQADLRFTHDEKGIELVRARYTASGPVSFTYLFPEGAPYVAKLDAVPVKGGQPVSLTSELDVEPVHPSRFETWRGYMVGLTPFLVGGLAGLFLGRRLSRRRPDPALA